MIHALKQLPSELVLLLLFKCTFVGILIFLIDKHATANSGIKVLINVLILISMSIWVLGLFYAWNLTHLVR